MSDLKTCTKCRIEQSETNFSKLRGGKKGLQASCKTCIKEYDRLRNIKRYKENPEKIREQNRLWRKRNPEKVREIARLGAIARKKRKLNIRDWIVSKYENTPCMDCGRIFPWCAMDFDHRPGEIKEFSISTLGQHKATSERIAKLEKEISKCDLVDASCHRIRTWITRKK